jgi:hypothetical protein
MPALPASGGCVLRMDLTLRSFAVLRTAQDDKRKKTAQEDKRKKTAQDDKRKKTAQDDKRKKTAQDDKRKKLSWQNDSRDGRAKIDKIEASPPMRRAV